MHINNEKPNLQPDPKKPELFNLAKMFHAHLKLMNVDVAMLKPYEIKRIKLAFYGGISCHIVMLGHAINKGEQDADVILKNIDDQINEYWKSENIDFNLN